ncbi:MAG TPA: quinone oxidoreductase [Kofleriaceae bacterium]|nr:quinone oxidoreductase [Kofleriaceae bacterium]
MRAARVTKLGNPDVIEILELPDPVPGPEQVLVRVDYAGVNFIDVYHRTGLYPQPLPFGLGEEGAGVVIGVGPMVGIDPGTRVAWVHGGGSYATHAVIPAASAVPIPDGIETEQAAALMLQGMTAHYLSRSTFRLAHGHVCVVHAAAGGVGLLLTQLARGAGARVIGVVSTEAKADAARAAGCELVVKSGADLVAAVKEATDGRGADVVYDSVGNDTFEQSLDALAPRGMLVLYGQSSGPVPPIDLQLLSRKGSLYATRPTLRHYTQTRAELLNRAHELFTQIVDGSLKLTIDRTLPLDHAPDAHRLLESRATSGKLLLDCR